MDNQPSIDRSILLPILIGGFSIFGILIILLIGRVNSSRASIAVEPTETPFKYIFLGTEPIPSIEGTAATEEGLFTGTPFEDVDDTPIPSLPVITGTLTTPTLGTPIISRASPTNTPPGTVASPTRAATIIYDDADSRLVYNGNWTSQTNVSGAYQGTLHISSTVNNSVVFLFLGDRIRISYQAGPSLGTVAVTIDSLGSEPISQASSTTEIMQWESDLLVAGNHEVVITHSGGGSVNIDSIAIPQSLSGTVTSTTPAPTATPTRTPTP
jgi:hypothetical protein